MEKNSISKDTKSKKEWLEIHVFYAAATLT
jgi:hypothetical protein